MTEQVIEWRRMLHRRLEIGWTEFQTLAKECELAAGHHNSAFDFCEESLPFAVELSSNMLLRLV